MDIKCIALDLDRTTLDAEGRLSPGNREALEYAIARGVHIVIASGRSFGSLPRDVVSVPGIEYAITSNGAAVCHVPTGRRLHGYVLEPRSVLDILRLTEHEPVVYETFINGEAYADAAYVRDPVAHGATPQAIPYIQSTRRPEPDIRAFIRAHSRELDSLDLVVGDENTKQRIWAELERAVPDIYVTSSVQQLIEISHADAGKHAGVRYVTELLGLSPAQTAAFGDGDNDADMLRYVGCGIAVANAAPACLAAADYVTASHDRDGVARGIYDILQI
ncbi:MAG: HAD family hydrolase [Oscillospiraceae bacterium]|nr:HAD family hydrolase [Oscillospiraceae bacterium]